MVPLFSPFSCSRIVASSPSRWTELRRTHSWPRYGQARLLRGEPVSQFANFPTQSAGVGHFSELSFIRNPFWSPPGRSRRGLHFPSPSQFKMTELILNGQGALSTRFSGTGRDKMSGMANQEHLGQLMKAITG